MSDRDMIAGSRHHCFRAGTTDMSLLERAPFQRDEAEALFKEARQRRRRRWLIGCITVSLALLAATAGLVATSGTANRRPVHSPLVLPAPAAPAPSVNLTAFRGHGRLAFVSRGALWIMNGNAQTLHHVDVPRGVVPLAPTFSPDGRWLAFLTGSAPLMHAALWMANADGSDVHRVPGIVLGDAFGWSPRADLYAVAAGPISIRFPFGQPTTVRLVSPAGTVRTVATAPGIVGAAWSPDGSRLAVSTIDHAFVPSLTSYPVSTGTPTIWTGVAGMRQDFIVPAGWWNHWGVVYTVIGNGSVPDGEGSFEDALLYSISSPADAPRYLGTTLTNDSAGAPTGTTSGDLAFVSDGGASMPRVPWSGKQVVVCPAALNACTPAPAPQGHVTVDPSWSPSGSTLEYVTAPELSTDEFMPGAVAEWYGAHDLVLYDADTGGAASAAAPGATVPLWSSNGSNLLYEAGNGLWLTTPSGTPIEVANPLFTQTAPPSYYGEIDWAQQFGWSGAAPPATSCYVVCDPQL